jgi:hypothetical protein
MSLKEIAKTCHAHQTNDPADDGTSKKLKGRDDDARDLP